MTTISLQPGEMRFHQWCEPPLTAGQYRLHALQKSAALEAEFETTLDFVRGHPALRAAADRRLQRLSPERTSGEFSGTFPHIVLSRRTLPWERTLEPGTLRRAGDTSLGSDC